MMKSAANGTHGSWDELQLADELHLKERIERWMQELLKKVLRPLTTIFIRLKRQRKHR